MEMWMKVLSALFMVAMLVFLFPRAKAMLKHSPKAVEGDWQAVLWPIIGVILFILLLIQLV